MRGPRPALTRLRWELCRRRTAAAHPVSTTEVAGARVGYDLRGERHRPLVVLEAGLGTPGMTWDAVQTELTDLGIASLSYDRPGLGGSASVRPQAPLADEHAAWVAELLDTVAPGRPVWLGGHSVGGLLARCTAETLGERVRGLLLIDPTHPDQWELPAQRELIRSTRQRLTMTLQRALASRHGTIPEVAAGADAVAATAATPLALHTALAELDRWHPDWSRAAAAAPDPQVPVLVVSASVTRRDPSQRALHDDLLTLSPNARLVVLDTDHLGLLTDPASAVRTAGAIAEQVSAALTAPIERS